MYNLTLKRFVIFLFLLLISLSVAAALIFTPKKLKSTETAKLTEMPPTGPTVKVNDKVIQVELANTPEKARQGLSGRDTLPANSGMLFSFDNENIRPFFWMKDMHFAIDIIWIDDDRIVQIDKNVPPPPTDTADPDLPTYVPNQAIDHVLEVNAGFADKYGIKVGDEVELPGS